MPNLRPSMEEIERVLRFIETEVEVSWKRVYVTPDGSTVFVMIRDGLMSFRGKHLDLMTKEDLYDFVLTKYKSLLIPPEK